MKRFSIDTLTIDEYVWNVRNIIVKKHGYGIDQSYNVSYPLTYYINTGRASAQFLHDMQYVKPFVMARILANGYKSGTVDECIVAIKKKVAESVK